MAPRGQARDSGAASIESEIAHLCDLDLKALRVRWRGVTGRAAPSHLPKHLLFAMLAYRIQCDKRVDLCRRDIVREYARCRPCHASNREAGRDDCGCNFGCLTAKKC